MVLINNKISLILCFRYRHDFLKKLLDSAVLTMANSDNFEFIIAIDDDDDDTIKRIPEYIRTYSQINIRFFITRKNEHFVREFINPMARLSLSEWVIVLNADMEFKTQDWDRIILERMNEFKKTTGDSCVIGYLKSFEKENLSKSNCSFFSVFGRDYIKLFDGVYPEQYRIWGADHAVSAVFRNIPRRILLINDVLINHISCHNGQREQDINYKKFRIIHDNYFEEQAGFNPEDWYEIIKKAFR